MPDSQKQLGNSQTLFVELSAFQFETLEHSQGYATVIRFRLENESIRMCDALVVLDGPEIRFHGMIGAIDDQGWAVAVDRRGSTVPAGVQ